MKYGILLLLIGILAFSCADAGNKQPTGDPLGQRKGGNAISFEEYCKTAPCRRNISFKLKKENGTYFTYSSELGPPIVQPSFITIYAQETIYIEAKEGEEGPIEMIHVSENKHPERTIVFDFKQRDDTGSGHGMYLTVNNPFPRPLRYNLGMMLLTSEQLYKTSSCPVIGGGKAFEHWPHPIFQLVVANMRFLDAGDDMACKE